jgi:hypothetical protein
MLLTVALCLVWQGVSLLANRTHACNVHTNRTQSIHAFPYTCLTSSPNTGMQHLQRGQSHPAESFCCFVRVLMPIWQYAQPRARYLHPLPARPVGPAIAAGPAPYDLLWLSERVRGWLLWQQNDPDRGHVQWQVRRWGRVLPGCKRSATRVPSWDIPPHRCRRPSEGKLHSVRPRGLQS